MSSERERPVPLGEDEDFLSGVVGLTTKDTSAFRTVFSSTPSVLPIARKVMPSFLNLAASGPTCWY